MRPPRVWPSHSPSSLERESLLAARVLAPVALRWARMWVLSSAAPVDSSLVVGKGLQGLEEAQPRAVTFPSGEAVVAGAPRTVPLRDVTPRRPDLDAPEDAIEDAPMVGVRMAAPGVGGQVRPEGVPLRVGKICTTGQTPTLPPCHEFSCTDAKSGASVNVVWLR